MRFAGPDPTTFNYFCIFLHTFILYIVFMTTLDHTTPHALGLSLYLWTLHCWPPPPRFGVFWLCQASLRPVSSASPFAFVVGPAAELDAHPAGLPVSVPGAELSASFPSRRPLSVFLLLLRTAAPASSDVLMRLPRSIFRGRRQLAPTPPLFGSPPAPVKPTSAIYY